MDTRSSSDKSRTGDESRVAQLEAELVSANEHAERLEAELGEIKEAGARQELEIEQLRVRQTPDRCAVEVEPPKTSRSRYYSRKRRSKLRKLKNRVLRVAGIVTLALAFTGVVVGFVYVIDASIQGSQRTYSSDD